MTSTSTNSVTYTQRPVGWLLHRLDNPFSQLSQIDKADFWANLIKSKFNVSSKLAGPETFRKLAYERQITLLKGRISELWVPGKGGEGEVGSVDNDGRESYLLLVDVLTQIYLNYSSDILLKMEGPKTLRFEHSQALTQAFLESLVRGEYLAVSDDMDPETLFCLEKAKKQKANA